MPSVTFRKFTGFDRLVCVMFALYMLNAFTLLNLLGNFSLSHLSGNTITCKVGQTSFVAPKKADSKSLYLFMVRRKITKADKSNEISAPVPVFAATVKVPIAATAVICQSNPSSFSLSDDAYRRYLNLKTFLI